MRGANEKWIVRVLDLVGHRGYNAVCAAELDSIPFISIKAIDINPSVLLFLAWVC